ncbi:MAG: helix-turn-helix domain-containing protein [Candidatus Doudnabacteria bacterium]
MKQKDSPLEQPLSEQKEILKKLSTLEDLLKKKDDKPLTFKEACAYLGYAPSYLYKLTYRKVVPHYKPTGKIIFFSKNELDEWIFRSRSEKLEDRSMNESKDISSSLNIKDPNQIEMDLEKEVLIEFPLKSRRKKIERG